VSSEPLGFLPDRFGDVAFLDDGDFSLDSARDGVRRHLRTQAFLGASNDLDRSCLHQGRGLEDVERPHERYHQGASQAVLPS
jgi:hypothetical protein